MRLRYLEQTWKGLKCRETILMFASKVPELVLMKSKIQSYDLLELATRAMMRSRYSSNSNTNEK